MFPLRPPFFGYPFNNFYANSRRNTSHFYNVPGNRNNFTFPNTAPEMHTNSVSNSYLSKNFKHFETSVSSENLSSNKSEQLEKKSSRNEPFDDYFFEIFGLKLYLDDILIMCLLFFLYEEEVNDRELFISLILLLLS